MLGLVQRTARDVEEAPTVIDRPAPRGLRDVRPYAVRGSDELLSDNAALEARPRADGAVELASELGRQAIRVEITEIPGHTPLRSQDAC